MLDGPVPSVPHKKTRSIPVFSLRSTITALDPPTLKNTALHYQQHRLIQPWLGTNPRGEGNIMSATEFGLTVLYIAVAVFFYAAGWWQGKTVERDRWEERGAAQDQLVQHQPVQRGQPGQEPVVPVPRQPIRAR
jgi:hypothetical protein